MVAPVRFRGQGICYGRKGRFKMSMVLEYAKLEVSRYERMVAEMKERHMEELVELEANLTRAKKELAKEEKYDTLVKSWS